MISSVMKSKSIKKVTMSVLTLLVVVGISTTPIQAEQEPFQIPEEVEYGEIDEDPVKSFKKSHGMEVEDDLVKSSNDIQVSTPDPIQIEKINSEIDKSIDLGKANIPGKNRMAIPIMAGIGIILGVSLLYMTRLIKQEDNRY